MRAASTTRARLALCEAAVATLVVSAPTIPDRLSPRDSSFALAVIPALFLCAFLFSYLRLALPPPYWHRYIVASLCVAIGSAAIAAPVGYIDLMTDSAWFPLATQIILIWLVPCWALVALGFTVVEHFLSRRRTLPLHTSRRLSLCSIALVGLLVLIWAIKMAVQLWSKAIQR